MFCVCLRTSDYFYCCFVLRDLFFFAIIWRILIIRAMCWAAYILIATACNGLNCSYTGCCVFIDIGLLSLLHCSQRVLDTIIQKILIIWATYRAILIATACIEPNCSATECSVSVSELWVTFIVALFSESSWNDYLENYNYLSYVSSYSYCYSLYWA
jgi:hypothetical protein